THRLRFRAPDDGRRQPLQPKGFPVDQLANVESQELFPIGNKGRIAKSKSPRADRSSALKQKTGACRPSRRRRLFFVLPPPAKLTRNTGRNPMPYALNL